MVIAYDMAPLTRMIMQRMLITDTVTLVNLVSDTRVIPEFIGDDCDATKIAPALSAVLEDPRDQFEALEVTMDRLGRGGEEHGCAEDGSAELRRGSHGKFSTLVVCSCTGHPAPPRPTPDQRSLTFAPRRGERPVSPPDVPALGSGPRA